MSRPVVVFTLCYILGILLTSFFQISTGLLFSILFIIICISILIHSYAKKINSVLLILSFIVLGLFRTAQVGEISTHQLLGMEQYSNEHEFVFTGRIVGNPFLSSQQISYIVDHIAIQTSNGFEPVSGKLLVNLKNNVSNQYFLYNDPIFAMGQIQIPPLPRNPGGFNYREYLVRHGIYGIVYLKTNRIFLDTNMPESNFAHILNLIPHCGSEIRYEIVTINNKLIPTPFAALANGIFLGLQSDIPDEIKDIYRKAGIYHLLVVSGGHVWMMGLLAFVLFRSFCFKRRSSAIFTIPIILFYGFIAGFSPPVTRAVIMAVIILLGLILRRDTQVINSLSLAACIILLLNPYELFDSSFQFSYLAVLGIATLSPILESIYPLRRPQILMRIIYCTLSAFITLIPLMAKYFNLIPVYSMLTNIVNAPLISISLPASFLTGISYPLSPNLAQFIANTNWLILRVLTKTTEYIVNSSGAYIIVPSWPLWRILVYYFFLLCFIYAFNPLQDPPDYRFRKHWLYAVMVYCILWIFIPVSWNHHSELKVTFLDVDQGDCIVLEFPNGKSALVDGGGREPLDHGKRDILPYLFSHGITHVDMIVFTHPDSDHAGGLISVLERVPVNLVLVNGWPEAKEKQYLHALSLVQSKNIPCQIVHRGQEIPDFEPCRIEVLNPPESFLTGTPADDNNNGIVLRVSYGDYQFLLTADIQSEAELDMLNANVPLNSTILKVGHHGSKASSTEAFLEKVHPLFAVIQVGKHNHFGHPSPQTLNRLNQFHIQIYRNDQDGAIIAKTDGKVLQTTSMEKEYANARSDITAEPDYESIISPDEAIQ